MHNNTHKSKFTDFSIAHLNVRSICTGFTEFTELVSDHNFSILALSETWLTKNINSNEIPLPGYGLYRKDRAGRGGGVGVYIKSHIKCELLDTDNDQHLEHIWLEVRVDRHTLVLGVVYRPPQQNLLRCTVYLDNFLPPIISSCDYVIVLGDVNVNLIQLQNPLSGIFDILGFT